MGIILDTNIITKILAGDTTLVDQLWTLSGDSRLLLPDPVVAEVRVFCNLTKNIPKSLKAFENLIDQLECEITPCTKQIWEYAADIFTKYLQKRDIEKLQCPKCGTETVFRCPQCRIVITSRQHILMDFVIGAFAALDKDKSICTLDNGVYKTYFPELNLV